MNFCYPGGLVREIPIPATAGNVVTNLSPGAGKRWMILRSWFTLVCEVSVGNRYLILELLTGSNVLTTNTIVSPVAVSGATVSTGMTPVRFLNGSTTGGNSSAGLDPISTLMEGLDKLRISIASGVAGDSYSGMVVVLEVPS